MGRTYAGILGPISFCTVIARSMVDGLSTESALIMASLALFVFAAIGYLIGTVAERMVVEAIESRIRAERQQADSARTVASSNPNQSAANAA
jgi:hypothetical protein